MLFLVLFILSSRVSVLISISEEFVFLESVSAVVATVEGKTHAPVAHLLSLPDQSVYLLLHCAFASLAEDPCIAQQTSHDTVLT